MPLNKKEAESRPGNQQCALVFNCYWCYVYTNRIICTSLCNTAFLSTQACNVGLAYLSLSLGLTIYRGTL